MYSPSCRTEFSCSSLSLISACRLRVQASSYPPIVKDLAGLTFNKRNTRARHHVRQYHGWPHRSVRSGSFHFDYLHLGLVYASYFFLRRLLPVGGEPGEHCLVPLT